MGAANEAAAKRAMGDSDRQKIRVNYHLYNENKTKFGGEIMSIILIIVVLYLMFKFKVRIWEWEMKTFLKIIVSLIAIYVIVNIVCEIWSLIWFWFLSEE